MVEHRSESMLDREQRANAFAAHFLLPRKALIPFVREYGLREGERPSAAHVRAVSTHFGVGVEATAAHFISCGLWSREEMLRHRSVYTREMHGIDSAELSPSQAESAVPVERRGEVLELATIALDAGLITVGRWRELVGLSVLPPAGVSVIELKRELNQRSMVCSVPDGRLRFSPHWPNGPAEIPDLLSAIDECWVVLRG